LNIYQNDTTSWQRALSDLVTDPSELLSILELDPALKEAAYLASQSFALKVPRTYVKRMQKGNIHDPLLQQVLPLGIELLPVPGYGSDPLEEVKVNPVPGLLHKYHGRVLVTLTGACAIHCRFCFRRHFPYHENNPGKRGWTAIFDYIKKDTSIHEVILSGGDPLAVNDHVLQSFTEGLIDIPHLKRLRIHTRLPVVLPERITQELMHWISSLKLNLIIVLHTNHPQEINEEVCAALKLLRQAQVHLLNQSVLLKGINDDACTLISLSQTLFAAGVLPYYLHVLDKVAGAAHFDLDRESAHVLHQQLSTHLPGYLVPRLVCEEAGQLSKVLL
jgi:EF-P beta-lysylation protein EpmB